jgi:hypothetical protein
MPDILVRLKIPIPAERTVGVPALIFSRWLSLGEHEGIVKIDGELELTLWFDIRSAHWASGPTEEDLEKHINVPAHYVYSDVRVKSIDQELIDYIISREYRESVTSENKRIQAEYDDLAWRVLSLALTTLNRFLSYVKARWGQHWLTVYSFDRGTMYSAYVGFEGKTTLDGTEWFRFGPSPVDSRNIKLVSTQRYIRREEWSEIQEYVQSNRRPPITKSLLAGAESLAAKGDSRAALTEAVTALEVALFEFAANPKVDELFGSKFRRRLGLQSLKSQVDRIGLTASINYLLPVLMPETELSLAVLDGCREAIQQRQNVVHQGQRQVQNHILSRSLKSVRAMCDTLESCTIYVDKGHTDR